MSVVLSRSAMQEKIDVPSHTLMASSASPPSSSKRHDNNSDTVISNGSMTSPRSISKTASSSFDLPAQEEDPAADEDAQHSYVRTFFRMASSASDNNTAMDAKDVDAIAEDGNENDENNGNIDNASVLPAKKMSTRDMDEDKCDDDDDLECKNESGQAAVTSSHAGRFSESAVPEKMDPEFVMPLRPNDYKSTRSSLVSFEPSAKANDGAINPFNGNNNPNFRRGGNFVDFSMRDSCASEAIGFDALNFMNVDDGELSLSSSIVTPRSMMRTNPYEGISIEVNNHSINNQGVVMYHVDIKGPEGLLSTYTIRRRYKAFKELHQELNRLISEYTVNQTKESAQAQTEASISDTFSAANVPDSPHTQARKNQTLQQIAEGSVLNASFTFPALPNGGVWSYLKRHDVRLVEQRKKRFEEILRIAIRHPATKTSAMLDSFLSVAPSLISQRGSSYVSLQDYSVPVFDRQRESIERKQLKLRLIEGRRQRTSSEASSSQS
ncbi:hypothetical protein FI667_g5236, partial [Globisporangium splendens]